MCIRDSTTTTRPVVAGVSFSTNHNVILTTTPDYTADYLLQHREKWEKALLVAYTRIQKQQKWAQLVAHGIYMYENFIALLALLGEDIENFNSSLTI